MSDAVAIVVAVLNADTSVKAIVGTSNYPMKLPQRAVLPANLISLVHGKDEQLVTGPAGYYEERVRVASIAAEPGDAIDLGTAVRKALGGVVKATIAGATDVDIYLDGSMDETGNADERLAARRIQDFSVRYRDA